MLINRFSTIVFFAVSLAACAVGPEYKKPKVTLSNEYSDKNKIEQRAAATSTNLETWWDGFNDPLLTRFVLLAFEQNLDLAQSTSRINQARSGLRLADIALLPSGNLSATAARNHQSLETPLGQLLNATPNFNRNVSFYETNLSASWETDLFGGLKHEQEAAIAEYQAFEASKIATRLSVAAQTADLYINIRNLQNRIDITRQQLEKQKKLLSIVDLLNRRGLAAKLEVYQAESAVSQTQSQIPALEANLDMTMNALDVILGVSPGTFRSELSSKQAIPTPPQISSIGNPSDLLRRRPDLIVAEKRLVASNARIGAAISEYYPKLSITALIGSATAISSGNLFSSNANQATGVLGLRWRLFDFKRIDAQVSVAKGVEAESIAKYRQSVLRATQDVEDSFTTLINNEEQTLILGQAETSLSNARNSAFAAYEKGTVSLMEVLQADENLLKMTNAKVQAQSDSARAAVAAFKSLGGGWDFKEVAASSEKNVSLVTSPTNH
jgi:NodT family efflux transporter outer membrane factor (OMF) lipoprotein